MGVQGAMRRGEVAPRCATRRHPHRGATRTAPSNARRLRPQLRLAPPKIHTSGPSCAERETERVGGPSK
eukprot:1434520-Pyramimonas_sp.AAC.1